MPILVRQGLANVTLSLKHKTLMRLVALDLRGNRRDIISVRSMDMATGTDWQLDLNNINTTFRPAIFSCWKKYLHSKPN